MQDQNAVHIRAGMTILHCGSNLPIQRSRTLEVPAFARGTNIVGQARIAFERGKTCTGLKISSV
jgi:hypothetical protein